MKLNVVVLSGAIIASLGLGIIIGRMTDEALLDRAPIPGSGPSSNPAVLSSAFDQQNSYEEIRAADAPRAARPAPEGLEFLRLAFDPSAETPTACLEFSQILRKTEKSQILPSDDAIADDNDHGRGGNSREEEAAADRAQGAVGAAGAGAEETDGAAGVSDPVMYVDYIDIQPATKAAISAIGRRLCISGLAYAQEFEVTVKSGLPSEAGERLERTEQVKISFGDQPPFVGFAGEGYVMPRLESDGIGIETVNVDKVGIRILQINDRALIQKSLSAGQSGSEGRYRYNNWGAQSADDVGVPVWEGEIETAATLNEKILTVFPIGAALGQARKRLDSTGNGLKPGAYYVEINDASAGANQTRPAQAWRWLLFTDMALSSYRGDSGIDIVVRSLKTARPLPGVEVALIARNNEILATKTSDGDGLVRFPAAITRGDGARAPGQIMAYGGRADFASLDLTRAGLDLSDRDIGGQAVALKTAERRINPYLYTERGIYRPGEIVYLTGLLRDDQMRAIEDRPLTLRIRRPNGTIEDEIRVESLLQGGFSRDFTLSRSAPRGRWLVDLALDGVGELRQVTSFFVEDFIPQRLKVEIEGVEPQIITAPGRYPVKVGADFLYGAPGAGLRVEGDGRLEVDPAPFDNYADYSFGLDGKTFSEKRLKLGETETDGDGKAGLTLAIDSIPMMGVPLRAVLVASVAEPGGRVVRESIRLPVRLDTYYIGLRRENTGQTRDNAPVKFDVVMLDAAAQQVKSSGNSWRLYEEDYSFEWYYQDDEWRWRRNYTDILVATGEIDFTAGKASAIERNLPAGAYRLEVEHPQSGAKSSVRFHQGWRSYDAAANAPDEAVLTPPDYDVKPGDRARFTLDAPYEGDVYLAVATDRIHEFRRFRLSGGAQELTLPTKAEWGNGFYVLATIVTPRDAVDRPVPRRAVAVSYVPFDTSASTLEINLDIPEIIRPRQIVDITGEIDGLARDEEVYMTLMAVDEGILRITKYDSPAPEAYYFAKKILGVQLHDDYGNLLNPNLAAATGFGGDSLGGEGLSVVPTKSVALFSGPVRPERGGKVVIPVEIPDFNGSLRVMAVAWSADKVGSSAQEMIVRDPVPASLSLPRFLAPNDRAEAILSIDNVEGVAGAYNVILSSSGVVDLADEQSFTLDRSSRSARRVAVEATDIGRADVELSVTGPEFSVLRRYPIEVRAPYYPVTETTVSTLAPGDMMRLDQSLLGGFIPGSSRVTVSFSPLRGISPRPLLDSLAEYPYSCTEQLTAVSWPMLHRNQLARFANEDENFAIRERVQTAINKISARQSQDGAFGLWYAGDRFASGWIGGYVTDFLMRAQQDGYKVAQSTLAQSYQALSAITSLDRWAQTGYQMRSSWGEDRAERTNQRRWRAAAYAHYILARADRADLSDIRYFHDNFIEKIESPLARMHIGIALALLGDRGRAANSFALAEKIVGYQSPYNYYQSPMRDIAAMIALAAEVENTALTDRLLLALDQHLKEPDAMHNQEKLFLLRATAALLDRTGEIKISINDTEGAGGITGKGGIAGQGETTSRGGTVGADGLADPDGASDRDAGSIPSFVIDPADLAAGVTFANKGAGPVFATLTSRGVPTAPPAPRAEGFSLAKSFHTLDGEAISSREVRQNDRVIIRLEGKSFDQRRHEAIIVDMLPAGFEIESIIPISDTNEGAVYEWIGPLSGTKTREARDDRFIAAIDLYSDRYRDRRGFILAYMVRAITPGTFTMPGAIIEDMYRPGQFARTRAGTLQVNSAQ